MFFGRPDNHKYVSGSGILLDTLFLQALYIMFYFAD